LIAGKGPVNVAPTVRQPLREANMTGLGTQIQDDLIAKVRARKNLPTPVMRRAIRVEANASLRAIAEAVGVTPQAVAFWEQGQRTPRGDDLVRYVEVLSSLEREGSR
jgi:DNA-binding transcriptional regulator YiaG